MTENNFYDDEIIALQTTLGNIEMLGTEEWNTAYDALKKIVDLSVTEKKFELEKANSERKIRIEKSRAIGDLSINFIKAVGGLATMTGLALASLKFEEEGYINSFVGKTILQTILKK